MQFENFIFIWRYNWHFAFIWTYFWPLIWIWKNVLYVCYWLCFEISHVDLCTLQIYSFEMPTNFLISNDVCVHLIQLMLDEIQLQAWWNVPYTYLCFALPLCVMQQEQGLCILICINVGKNLKVLNLKNYLL
jgi:hypothetical protein